MTENEKLGKIDNDELRLRKILIEEEGSKLADNFIVKKINEGVFGILANGLNINSYVDGNGEVIFNLKAITNGPYFKKAQLLSGYVENKNPNGEYEMYRINTINGKPFPNGLLTLLSGNINNINVGVGEKVDKYSIEYFNTWVNIDFYQQWLLNETLKLSPVKGESYTVLNEEYLTANINIGVIRIKDLSKYLEQSQLQGGQVLFDKLLPKVRDKLLSQIGDIRFLNVGDVVTKEELEGYYKKGYINKDLYDHSIKLLEELSQQDLKKNKDQSGLVSSDLKLLKQEVK